MYTKDEKMEMILVYRECKKKMVRKLHLFTDGDFQIGSIHVCWKSFCS
jgi:hypothetical protein